MTVVFCPHSAVLALFFHITLTLSSYHTNASGQRSVISTRRAPSEQHRVNSTYIVQHLEPNGYASETMLMNISDSYLHRNGAPNHSRGVGRHLSRLESRLVHNVFSQEDPTSRPVDAWPQSNKDPHLPSRDAQLAHSRPIIRRCPNRNPRDAYLETPRAVHGHGHPRLCIVSLVQRPHASPDLGPD